MTGLRWAFLKVRGHMESKAQASLRPCNDGLTGSLGAGGREGSESHFHKGGKNECWEFE